MMALTFVTGMLDAVGYLGLDHIFTGNMTGNILILGMGAAGGYGLPVLGPVLALTSFIVGAAIAGTFLNRQAKGWNRRVTLLLGAGTVVLSGTSILLLIAPSKEIQALATCAMAVHMGSQMLIARFLAVRDITTAVVTSTIVSLAGESFFGPGKRLWNRRLAAVVVVFSGAVMGTAIIQVHLSVAIFTAVILIASVTLIGKTHWNNEPAPAKGTAMSSTTSTGASSRN